MCTEKKFHGCREVILDSLERSLHGLEDCSGRREIRNYNTEKDKAIFKEMYSKKL